MVEPRNDSARQIRNVGTGMMIGAKQLFKPIMAGWLVYVVLVSVVVTVVLAVNGGQVPSPISIFGVTLLPDGNLSILSPLSFGVVFLFAGLLQGVVIWAIVSLGLVVLHLLNKGNRLCQQDPGAHSGGASIVPTGKAQD